MDRFANRLWNAPNGVDILIPNRVDYLRMATARKESKRMELLQGTLDLLVLRTVQDGPQHGHGIANAIKENSGDVFRVETGSLYPALHRLHNQGWLRADWKTTENGQRAKYYRLTAAGKKQLSRELAKWDQMVQAISRILNGG
jgi:PadR family transcriptional regulator PadR